MLGKYCQPACLLYQGVAALRVGHHKLKIFTAVPSSYARLMLATILMIKQSSAPAQTPQQEETICLDDSDDEAPSPAKPAAAEGPRRSTRSTRLIGTKELYEVGGYCLGFALSL